MKFTGVKQGEIPEWELAYPREPLERPEWEYMTYVIGGEHPGELTPLDLRTLWKKEHPNKKHPLERKDLDFRECMRITFEETDWLEDRKETVREKDSGMEY